MQLLYESPSLGRPVRLALKRLELLHAEPAGLRRSHDIDRFLSSFCAWQAASNPGDDSHPLHWDHALILTGLDLYVVGKGGKVSSQVVGRSSSRSRLPAPLEMEIFFFKKLMPVPRRSGQFQGQPLELLVRTAMQTVAVLKLEG